MAAKKSFPDLNKDGKVSKADVLKGRGVEGFEKGGKVKIERINKQGRTKAAEEMLRAVGEMRQGMIQEKFPSKGTRDVKESGEKFARVPYEPVSGQEPDVLEDALRYEREYGSGRASRRGDGDTQKFAAGGMVRGCKSVQTSGKGFKGTF